MYLKKITWIIFLSITGINASGQRLLDSMLVDFYSLTPDTTGEEYPKIRPVFEYTISVNRTVVSESDGKSKSGFGMGMLCDFNPGATLTCLLGLEYNRVSQKYKYGYISHFSAERDVIYHVNCLSIPLLARLNFGRKNKVLLDMGIFGDFITGVQKKSAVSHVLPHEDGQGFVFGVSGGAGIIFPVENKYDITLKGEYKLKWTGCGGSCPPEGNNYFRIVAGFRFGNRTAEVEKTGQ